MTVLMGTNASGKSNIRDAIRFFDGVFRGYTLAEILGEKWFEGGILQWRGIRGGTRKVAYKHKKNFILGLDFSMNGGTVISYDIEAIKTHKETLDNLKQMKFLDLSPDAMRQPSIPGQTELSDMKEFVDYARKTFGN